MFIQETKNKLEFDRIISKIKHYSYSVTGEEKCDHLPFITDTTELDKELDKVCEVKDILNIEGELPLDGLKDIRRSVSKMKIEGYFISPAEFLNILDFLRVSRKVKKTISELNASEKESYPLIFDLTRELFFDKILEHNIEITVDENGEVKDTASTALNKIRKQINSHSGRLRKTLSEILRKVSEKEYTQEDIVTQRDGRYVIPVKVENKRNVDGIIHSSSATGATVFIEPTESIKMNNELTELHFEEKREIERILRELAAQLTGHLDPIKINIEILAELDFIQAKARYAMETISVKPFIDKEKINLINAYHPVLLQTHKRNEVVPLNLSLGDEYNTLVISGPNAGGKTVVLKTVGLNQLMLQSGMLVPADPESEFKLFDKIFISIGDEQSLENDLSTFSSHLNSIKGIIDNADDRSLILIDEIASGTDPVLGSALSASILKDFSERNSLTIVTTHNSELKEFAYNTEKIENGSLEFNVGNLSPNFNFVSGVPGQSFTFEIARKFNFPESILNASARYLDENESRLEDLLKDLNETKQNYTILKNKYDVENSRLTSLTKLYESKLKEFSKNEKQLKYKAKLDAENIIRDANKLIEKTIKTIREDKQTPKEIKLEFLKEAEKITETEDLKTIEKDLTGDIVPDEKISEGDSVRIKNSFSAGEVMEISGDTASVNINGLIVKTKLIELEKISRKDLKKEYSDRSTVSLNEGVVELSLDLRGKYTHEIGDELEKFIYNSVSNGLKEVSIIHGKGSGKLREEVQKQLKRNSDVKSFRLGNWNEGDSGVTIIEL
ncbi:MAG TPA: endonuclease MutS2 [Ignavibacteria bacterium]|mgnify:CR=1 FL=1|nr:endonuclease MutS2 [Ignavibacteria bacterium]HMR40182.1 endonuclease MutS2 [Ignavibacteria bacterium]